MTTPPLIDCPQQIVGLPTCPVGLANLFMITALKIIGVLCFSLLAYGVLVKFHALCSQVNDIHDRLFAGTEQDDKRWKPEPYEKDSQ